MERFRDSPVGRLVPIEAEQGGATVSGLAFVPAPLPDTLSLSALTHIAVADAAAELARLDGMVGEMVDTWHITRPVMRREAVSTSAIEGTFSTLAEVLAADLTDVEPTNLALREVVNYVRAAEHGVDAMAARPVSLNLILELHGILLEGTRTAHAGGRWRSSQVAIGRPGDGIESARFVPPPHTEVAELLDDWERWAHLEGTFHALVRIAVAHYQFETIHPFLDGNGRIGRLIVVMQLIETGLIAGHFFSLSAYIERHRIEYQDLLAGVSETGDFDGWVRFFCGALQHEAERSAGRIRQLRAWRGNIVDRLRSEQRKGLVIQLAEWLIEQPVITVGAVAARFEVSFQSANRVVASLEADGVLEHVAGTSHPRLFASSEVLSILNS